MAGGVIDGQAVDAAVTDAAFIYKNADDTTGAKLGLNDGDVSLVSGTAIANSQREFNALWSFLGGLLNQAKTYLPSWSNNNFGTTTDTIKGRIEAIDGAFAPSGGSQARRAGRVSITNGSASVAVTFTTPWVDLNYVVEITIENTADATPIFLQAIVTTKTVNGFTATFNAPADTANYTLNYRVSKAA